MKYDPNEYENVKKRKLRFYEAYPDGRIMVEHIIADEKQALFKVFIYRNRMDHKRLIPAATGYAHEFRDTELSVGRSGQKYESVNYTSWIENCEESAVGRALDNAGFASNAKCSREEMNKVERHQPKPAAKPTKSIQTNNENEEYIIPFGKYKNQKLSEIDIFDLAGYVAYIEKKADQDDKPIRGQVAEFMNKAHALLDSRAPDSPLPNEAPQFDQKDNFQ